MINRIIYITDKGLKGRIKTALKEAAIEEFTTASKLIFDEDTNTTFTDAFDYAIQNTVTNALNMVFNETLRDALYWCDIDLYAYLDEFCFKVKHVDSRIVKGIIRTYYDNVFVLEDPCKDADIELILNTYYKVIFNNK